MALIVQKFGGASVADLDKMRRCASRTRSARDAGDDVLVVVSAMGAATDRLLDLARSANPHTPRRDLDMLLSTGEQASAALLSMTLQAMGRPAVAFTGQQIGLSTDDAHTRARIASIDTGRIRAHLARGRVVVVAGFQGVTREGAITTLGRGGSDLTAVALAAALGADACEIFTDVDGVFTADTRVVAHARKLDRLSYDQMLEFASLGARVLCPRAVLCAKTFHVPIHVRHSHRPQTGTLIVPETPEMEQIVVSGAALKPDLGRVSLIDAPNAPSACAALCEELSHADIFVDDIIQTELTAGAATVAVTVDRADLDAAGDAARRVARALGGGSVRVDVGLAKVSVVGEGMRTHTGVAATMFGALGAHGVKIRNVTTSEIKISCIVDEADADRALRIVHDAFELAPTPGAVSAA